MEVMPAAVGISEFRLRPLSSVEAVSIMETAEENSTLKIAVKTTSLEEDWKLASATKKIDHFEVFFHNNPEVKLIYKFDDEVNSLLSANLWEMGWYSLLEDDAPEGDLGKEQSSEEEVIFGDVIEFKGKSFPGNNCTIFESVLLSNSQESTETLISSMDNILHQSQKCVFFFAIQYIDKQEPEAVVFRFNPDIYYSSRSNLRTCLERKGQ